MSEKEEKQARYIKQLTQAQIKLIKENEILKSKIEHIDKETNNKSNKTEKDIIADNTYKLIQEELNKCPKEKISVRRIDTDWCEITLHKENEKDFSYVMNVAGTLIDIKDKLKYRFNK